MDDLRLIRYWNRETQSVETEQVYGEAAVGWLYGTTPGRRLADCVLSRSLPSRLYGMMQSSPMSRRKIRPFIERFGIRMDEYEEGDFRSFNEFFIRRFRPGARPFDSDPRRMPAFAEARYFAFESVSPDARVPVKGRWLAAAALIGDPALAASFEGGPLLLARLCPTDYHRFHYPDDGRMIEGRGIAGRLHSVNPLALRYKGEILATNERRLSVLETRNFGRLAYIEVGALCVGRIVQTHAHGDFHRGDEKGYFLFGGSTVIVLGEPGRWRPDADLLEQTRHGRESFVKLGTGVAVAATRVT